MAVKKKSSKKRTPAQSISPAELLRELPGARLVVYEPEAMIFREGSKAADCFVITQGKVRILKKTSKGETIPLGIVKPGEFLGEMAMLSGESRSASAVAINQVKAIVIKHDQFVALLKEQHPFASRLSLQISTLLALRCHRLLRLIARRPEVVPQAMKKVPPSMSAPSSTESIPSGPSDVVDSGLSGDTTGVYRALATVLIPARNESFAISHVVRGCIAAGFSVTVIDDKSRDATARLADEAGAEVLTLPGPHHGKTAALRHALIHLHPSIDWILILDGDGQHDPNDLERFWNLRSDADLIVGNRFPDAAHMPLLRRWTNRTMSACLRHSGILDSQCGFRLVRRAWLGSWLPAGDHFEFETEMALFAAARRGRVLNLPIAATYAREESKIVPLRDAINFARCLSRHRSTSPFSEGVTPQEQGA